MRKVALAVTAAAAMVGLAGIGHNMPPAIALTTHAAPQQAVLPRRIVDENRRNQKLKQKLRRAKRRQFLRDNSRAQRKALKFGHGYRPGKLFKGHRI